MIKNVGIIDRILRLLLGLFLIWIGVFVFNGKEGSLLGIGIAIISLLPFYMTFTGSCFVFNWFKIHSFSKKECEMHGKPYEVNKD
ncbi:MAG: DUF2892 domain-containing protein [Flavobacteriales bacterium]|nr:DUF2892 domain-containing protein [Flavobacteriales bacterium]